MAAKRKSSRGVRDTSRQVEELRATIKQLRTRLEREARARKIEARLVADTRKARAQVLKQMDVLRNQGRKLAAQLKVALTDAGRREQARKEALKRIADLKADLARRTDDVRRKSMELKKLAIESAERARAIITGEAEGARAAVTPPVAGESRAPGAVADIEGGEAPPAPEKEWP